MTLIPRNCDKKHSSGTISSLDPVAHINQFRSTIETAKFGFRVLRIHESSCCYRSVFYLHSSCLDRVWRSILWCAVMWSSFVKQLGISSARGNTKWRNLWWLRQDVTHRIQRQYTKYISIVRHLRQISLLQFHKHITHYKRWKCDSNLYGFDDGQTVTSLKDLG